MTQRENAKYEASEIEKEFVTTSSLLAFQIAIACPGVRSATMSSRHNRGLETSIEMLINVCRRYLLY